MLFIYKRDSKVKPLKSTIELIPVLLEADVPVIHHVGFMAPPYESFYYPKNKRNHMTNIFKKPFSYVNNKLPIEVSRLVIDKLVLIELPML